MRCMGNMVKGMGREQTENIRTYGAKRRYVLCIDQSTQGTKALLLDEKGEIAGRQYISHRQIISPEGYVSHDMDEVYANVVQSSKSLLKKSGVRGDEIAAVGISNQRETTCAWDRETGRPVCDAVVWQCGRAQGVCDGMDEEIRRYVRGATGIPLSPYFPAAKMRWILENVPEAGTLAQDGRLCLGTVDTYLLFRLTDGRSFKTDYSNASRTQLMDIQRLRWDSRLLDIFHVPENSLPEICCSDSLFGETIMEGLFPHPVPVFAMLGDSHAALFGHGCRKAGNIKVTYGTGSSIMMHTGEDCAKDAAGASGLVTSLAWGYRGKPGYVIEGNLNYTGAVISWLKNDLGLISSAKETETMARAANPKDNTYLVPAFTGLGAPYWRECSAAICGMTRTTGRNEIARAALDCIAYQITDVLQAMEKATGMHISEIRADGGPTANRYLMQMQSDIALTDVLVPSAEEFSAMGAGYMAGISAGLYPEEFCGSVSYERYRPAMPESERSRKYALWGEAVRTVIGCKIQ